MCTTALLRSYPQGVSGDWVPRSALLPRKTALRLPGFLPLQRPKTGRYAVIGIGYSRGDLGGLLTVLALLIPALAFPSRLDAVTYLAAFGAGTVAAMACFAAVVGLVARGSSRQGLAAYRAVLGVCSLAAVGIGVYWLWV